MELPSWLLSQLGRPTGFVGSLVASAMDRGNHTMALHALGALDLRANETLLDLGFGGGVGIAMALAHEPTLKVIGVDPAQASVARGRARFASSVVLHEGTVEALPLGDRSVDAVVSNNTVYFWGDLSRGLSELRRVLRPGGRLVLGIRPPEVLERLGFAARGLRVLSGEAYVTALLEAGFVEARARRMPDPTGTVLVSASEALLR